VQFLGGKHVPNDSLPSAVQKWLNGYADRDAVWVVDLGGHKEACVTWDAHWQKLANAIKPFMFSCPAK